MPVLTENPLNHRAWTKAGEAIGVPQSWLFSHPEIMPDLYTVEAVYSPS